MVSPRTAVESKRLQLAQRDRLLVGRATVHRRLVGGGDLVHMGRQSRVSHRRRNAARAARKSTAQLCKQRQSPSRSFKKSQPALARAEQQVSDWRSITLQLPASASAPLTFNIDSGTGGQPQKRAQLVLDRTSGEVVRWEPFSSYTRGRQLRSILRFAHTGEVAGIFGQTIAGIVSIGGAVPRVYRIRTRDSAAALRGWRSVRRSAKPAPHDVSTPIPDSGRRLNADV